MASKLPSKKTVELFYDVLSPYSWVAFEVLCRYSTKWNIDLKLKPFLLAGIMQGAGNRPPMMVPNKGAYMIHDLNRIRQFYQIPLKQPDNVADVLLNKGSLNAQRLLTAVQFTHPNLLEKITREIWTRIWSRGEDISTPEVLTQAMKAVGLNDSQATELLGSLKDDKIRNKLKEVTQEALDHGAFGAPTIIATDAKSQKHLVFGSDRFEILAMILGEKYQGPLTELAASKL
jgi:glutathione S-transferase kappa 1